MLSTQLVAKINNHKQSQCTCSSTTKQRRNKGQPTYWLHDAGSLFLAGKETAKETVVGGLRLEAWGQLSERRVAVLGVDRGRVLGSVHAVIDHSHGLVSVQKVGMASVDVAGLHADNICHKLVGWVKLLAEKVDDNLVETVLQLRESLEELLRQELSQDANQLIKDNVDTAQTGVFQALDLLLNDDLESSSADKKRWRRTLHLVQWNNEYSQKLARRKRVCHCSPSHYILNLQKSCKGWCECQRP